ncbi:MAG: pyridoxamine 5'-phosphate oxidase family protein [Prevotellaceae bacterium]|jgi:uncharacterized pyridoxamine 5'-phosphate oxidase family protein|nr:pyridoxamine 5'-phosphate oxidase family protein [Prevotellaceae bacterium]
MKRLVSLLSLFLLGASMNTVMASNIVDSLKTSSMQEVYDFLKKCGHYFIATVDGDQPRVRPFGTAVIFENKLYIQTGKKKNVSKQMKANPKIEICALDLAAGKWLRIAATVVEDNRREAKQYVLDQYPDLKSMYSADDDNTQVLYLKNVTATFSSFGGEPKEVKF